LILWGVLLVESCALVKFLGKEHGVGFESADYLISGTILVIIFGKTTTQVNLKLVKLGLLFRAMSLIKGKLPSGQLSL
jgi:hypothetical protein